MEHSVCNRDSSSSPKPLVAPVAVKPSVLEAPQQQLMTQAAAAAAAIEQQRLQQLYQLAIAERLRIASGFSWPRHPSSFEAGSSPPQLLPHPTINGHPNMLAAAAASAATQSYMYPWRFIDPRTLYRVPEEPKPQHSYIGLIAMAILSTPDKKLVLSDIYAYILDNYAYFRTRGPGWRNSIRHNLSLNDCFVKAGRSANGKGHYWAIHPANLDDFTRGDFRRRRAQRRVRKHLGLQVDDDSSPEPPPGSPTASLPESSAHLNKSPTNFLLPSQILPQSTQRKRQFDVASLLAPDDIPRDSLIKSRKYASDLSPIPTSISVSICARSNGSPELSTELQTRNNSEQHFEGLLQNGEAEDKRSWPLLSGWPNGHTWTILTPPQEDNDLDQRPSSPDQG